MILLQCCIFVSAMIIMFSIYLTCGLINVVVYARGYNVWSPLLCDFLHIVSFSPLGPHIFCFKH